MIITQKIKMELNRKGLEDIVHAVQGDVATRAVELTMVCDNVAWPVPEGVSILVRYRKPDGTGGTYDTLPDGSTAWSVAENTVTIILAPQVLTVPGVVDAQVEMVQGELVLGTFMFKIRVEYDPSAGAAASADYFSVRSFLPQITGAQAGQYMEIEEVDEQGRVVKFKPVAAPSGGSGGGADGVSPTVDVAEISGGHRLTITDVNGEKTVDMMDGEDGTSPTVTQSKANGVTTVKITDAAGTKTITINDGEDGAPGNGIKSAVLNADYTLTLTFDDGTTYTTPSIRGKAGKDGTDGVGIKSIARTAGTGAAGTTDTYTITYTDNTTGTFKVYNGKDGTNGTTPVKGVDYWTDADKAEMVEAVKDSMDGIPDYWQEHLDEKIALIREAMLTAGRNKSAFFFYSDSHWSNDTTYTAKMAPTLLKYLCKNTPINKTIFGGDIVGAEAADADTMVYLWEWRNQLYGLPNHHSVPGNHDDGNTTNNLFGENYVYGYLLAPEESCDIVRGDEGMYYYIDNPAEKTRYLYLDTAYLGVTDAEQEFVKAALIGTPADWHIVAIAHVWYYQDYTTYPPVLEGFDTNAKILLDMFDGYNAREGVYADCAGWVEFCIGGHYHLDHIEHTDGGIPVIIVEADCLHDRSGTMPKAGTTDESAISAVVADYNTKTVKIIRVGRGTDYETTIEVKTVSYTNVIPLSVDSTGAVFNSGKGWADASRIGSGTLESYIGKGDYYITGHIAIDPTIENTIRLRNITFDSTTHNNYAYQLALYNASYKKITTLYTTDISTESNGYAPVVADNNIVQFTLRAEHYPTDDTAAYIAICCSYIGDDSVITINEPIE